MLYEFDIFVSGIDLDTDLDRIYEAGCDDAVVGQRNGETYLAFSRYAETRGEATKSAFNDIAKFGGVILRIDNY